MREKIIGLLYDENVRSDCGIERLADEICAIDPVKKGKWIEVENKWGGLEIRCSECGAQVPRDGWGNAMQCNYCPNCGADMRGEEDE